MAAPNTCAVEKFSMEILRHIIKEWLQFYNTALVVHSIYSFPTIWGLEDWLHMLTTEYSHLLPPCPTYSWGTEVVAKSKIFLQELWSRFPVKSASKLFREKTNKQPCSHWGVKQIFTISILHPLSRPAGTGLPHLDLSSVSQACLKGVQSTERSWLSAQWWIRHLFFHLSCIQGMNRCSDEETWNFLQVSAILWAKDHKGLWVVILQLPRILYPIVHLPKKGLSHKPHLLAFSPLCAPVSSPRMIKSMLDFIFIWSIRNPVSDSLKMLL